MDRRAAFSPMEFEYDNKHGSIDSKSPWFTSTMNNSQGQNNRQGQTQQYSSFSSQTPSTPARQPASQSSVFSQMPPLKIPQQFGKEAFRNLRDNIDVDFSSGPENPSSPENADNEDTPEPLHRSSPSKINSNVTIFRGSASPSKVASSKIFSKHISPGRGEIPRRNYGDALARRVHKRKRRDMDKDSQLVYRRSSHDSDSEERSRPDSSGEGTTQRYPTHEVGFIPSIFSFIEMHPHLPHILSYYVQLLFNVFLVFFFIFIVYSFWATIRQDVDHESEKKVGETLAEMAICAREYVENRCNRDNRVPAMETVCNNWENCMNQDPNVVGRAKISAHMFAQIFNGLIEPISYKAMIFCLSLAFGCVAISNFAFGFFRNKAPPPPQSHYAYPQQQQSTGFPGGEHYYTPYQGSTFIPGMTTREMARDSSPSKRLGYR